jgi:hypothetical protein
VKILKSTFFMGLTSFKLSIHMLTDYFLYWVLAIIRHHGSADYSGSSIHAEGEGILAGLYRSMVKEFKLGGKVEVDNMLNR